MNTETGRKRNYNYTENIRLENIKVAMIDALDINNEYREFIKEHFKLKIDEITSTIDKWKEDCTCKIKKDKFESLKNQLINKVLSNDEKPFPES